MNERPTPRRPELMRIGDRERTEAAERLTAHAAAGRLSFEELEQRLDAVQSAVLRRDLDAIESDLPTPARRFAPSRPTPYLALAITLLAAAVLVTVVVGHPIPPLFIGALLLGRTHARRARGIVAES